MTEDEKMLSRECGDNMEDDAFKKWTKTLTDFPSHTNIFHGGYTAGYAQSERDIMARWPTHSDCYWWQFDNAKKIEGRLEPTSGIDLLDWLRSRLFPNDAKDEVKP